MVGGSGVPQLGGIEQTSDPADRRAHPRIPSIELPDTLIRIPHRAGVSLIDLSSGGALLALPFQMHPQSRMTVEVRTAAEQLAVPFQLLRCYVAALKGGVRYHAAGAFEETLDLAAITGKAPAIDRTRLIAMLERLLRAHQADVSSIDGRFSDVLSLAVAGIQRGESADLVAVRVKAHLTQMYASLRIHPFTPAWERDALRSAEFFGLTFRAEQVLTAADRRFLKLSAQLIAMMGDGRRAEALEDLAAPNGTAVPASPIVVYSAADWLAAKTPARESATRPSTRIGLLPRAGRSTFQAEARPASPRAGGPKPQRSRWLMGLL